MEVEVFQPKPMPPGGSKGAVIVLHGAGGLLTDGPEMRRWARKISGHGWTAFLPHYFNRTGTFIAGGRDFDLKFDDWESAVSDVVRYVRARPDLAGKPVVLLGYSLGAFLSLSEANNSRQIAGVVEIAGGIPAQDVGRVGKLPPMVLVHGQQDKTVPFSQALALEQILVKKRIPHASLFFPTEGHVLSHGAREQAMETTVQFLNSIRR